MRPKSLSGSVINSIQTNLFTMTPQICSAAMSLVGCCAYNHYINDTNNNWQYYARNFNTGTCPVNYAKFGLSEQVRELEWIYITIYWFKCTAINPS